MVMQPFDRNLVARRLSRAMRKGASAYPDFLHRHALHEIAARLELVNRTFERGLVWTAAPHDAVPFLLRTKRVSRLERACPPGVPAPDAEAHVLDPEAPDLPPGRFDLVISLMDLAFVNDLPSALAGIRRAMRPDGLFLAALPAGETFRELRAAWALADREMDGELSLRVAPFCTLEQIGDLLRLAGFSMPVTDLETLFIRHEDALALMQDIRAMGWSNPLRARSRRPVGRQRLARAAAHLEAACSEADGRLRTTVELCHVSAWVLPQEEAHRGVPSASTCEPAAGQRRRGT